MASHSLRYSLIFMATALAARAEHAHVSPGSLPFSTEETTTTVKLILRHRVEWNRRTGEYKWDRLDAEMPGHFAVSLNPGRWNPREEQPQSVGLRMKVRDGEAKGDALRRPDASWAVNASTRLGPREFQWNDPEIKIHGLAVDADLALDSLSTSGPLQMVEAMTVRSVAFDLMEAGRYRLENLRVSGDWNRPNWRVEKLSADVFGGQIELAGSGRWGTQDPVPVSVTLKGESLDFHELLKAFNVPRADQVRGRVSGRLRVEAVGREWKIMAFDIGGDEGTVYLDRRMIADIISYALGTPVANPKVRELLADLDTQLTKSYGKDPLVPMRQMRIQGNLEPRKLHIWIPIRNDAVDILLEPLVDRGIVWDSWDYLVNAGAENVRGMNVDAEAERLDPAITKENHP